MYEIRDQGELQKFWWELKKSQFSLKIRIKNPENSIMKTIKPKENLFIFTFLTFFLIIVNYCFFLFFLQRPLQIYLIFPRSISLFSYDLICVFINKIPLHQNSYDKIPIDINLALDAHHNNEIRSWDRDGLMVANTIRQQNTQHRHTII